MKHPYRIITTKHYDENGRLIMTSQKKEFGVFKFNGMAITWIAVDESEQVTSITPKEAMRVLTGS